MDWRSSGRTDNFRYVRVDRASMSDTVVLGNVLDGGSVSRNSLTALKASASVDYYGTLDIGNDFLRIYSVSEADGEQALVTHGTFVVSTPETDIADGVATGTARLYSLLLLLERRRSGVPLVVPAGTKAVAFAVGLARDVGLVVSADPSDAALTLDKTFDGNATYLEVVNDLLEFAGFRSVTVDGMGTARMLAIRDLSAVSPSITFRAGPGSTFSPKVRHTLDVFDVPNRLTVVCSRPNMEPMVATVINADPGNRYSTVSRGEVIDAETEEVDDIASQQALEELARYKLMMKTSAVESMELNHSYIPFEMDEGCRVVYGGYDLSGVIVSSETKLTPGMVSNTRIREFVRF